MECVTILLLAILMITVADCFTPNDAQYLLRERALWNPGLRHIFPRKKRALVMGCCGSGFNLSGNKKDFLEECFSETSYDLMPNKTIIVNPELQAINCALQCYGNKLHLLDQNGYLTDLGSIKDIMKEHFDNYNIKRIVKQHIKVCVTYANVAGAGKEVDDEHAKECNKATSRLFSCLLTSVHALCPKSQLRDVEECKSDRQNAKHIMRKFMVEIGW